MTTAANWLLNFCIAYATPYMVDPGPGNANMGSKVFFVWGKFPWQTMPIQPVFLPLVPHAIPVLNLKLIVS